MELSNWIKAKSSRFNWIHHSNNGIKKGAACQWEKFFFVPLHIHPFPMKCHNKQTIQTKIAFIAKQ